MDESMTSFVGNAMWKKYVYGSVQGRVIAPQQIALEIASPTGDVHCYKTRYAAHY